MNIKTPDSSNASTSKHWSRAVAETLVAERGSSAVFNCASGITPSGPVHVGNLRDVLTIWFVGQQLRRLGAQVRLFHSWDDFDRFRKVPAGFPASYQEFIGRPVTKVPDPEGRYPSFAARFAAEFEASVKDMGIDIQFKSQTILYESAAYGPAILEAIQKRRMIFDIINGFRTEPLPDSRKEAYLPIEIYCRRCWKDGTAVHILDEDAGLLRYECRQCAMSEEIAVLTAGNIKLPWKVDWPMRWRHEGVVFEPGGKDHATAGGSYLVASEVSRRVFGFEPPRFQGYEFIGLKGVAGKMSSSAGIAVTPKEALNLYPAETLVWLFAKAPPMRAFDLPVDQQLSQVYDEFDKAVAAAKNDREGPEAESVSLSGAEQESFVPFKTIGSLVALLDGNEAAVRGALKKLGLDADTPSVTSRIRRADHWLKEYLPAERIRLLDAPNAELLSKLPDEEKQWLRDLAAWVRSHSSISESDAQEVFQIPVKAGDPPEIRKVSQRRFFKCVYQALFGRDNGPRLPTFLAAIAPERYLHLLDPA